MDFNPTQRIRKMQLAIEQEAKERRDQILANAEQTYLVTKNKIENEEKEKIIEEYRKKIENYTVIKRIEKSAKNNEARLSKMTVRFELIQKVKDELKNNIKTTIKNKELYKDLLRKLIISGLIKLMEEEVELQCNKDDVELVESTLAAAQKQFEELVLKECNKTLKTKVTVNKTQYLDSGDFKYTGGIILSCLEGRIKFINTLDARIDLACSELLPQIRDGLFPNLATEMNQQLVKPQKVQEAHK